MTLAQATRRYRAAQAKTEQARLALYEAIREAHAEGLTYRAIAAETGLSFPRIQQIVTA